MKGLSYSPSRQENKCAANDHELAPVLHFEWNGFDWELPVKRRNLSKIHRRGDTYLTSMMLRKYTLKARCFEFKTFLLEIVKNNTHRGQPP